jgi:hypothetical protein
MCPHLCELFLISFVHAGGALWRRKSNEAHQYQKLPTAATYNQSIWYICSYNNQNKYRKLSSREQVI